MNLAPPIGRTLPRDAETAPSPRPTAGHRQPDADPASRSSSGSATSPTG